MAFPRNSLRAFLSHAKTTLQTAIRQRRKVTLVIGNESADLDSLTCSLLFAYIRSQAPPRHAFSTVYVPILNVPAEDVSLRPEFTALFKHADIEASQLITLDDLPSCNSPQSLLPEHTRWIVVDHNQLSGLLGSRYHSRVHGVIDHHGDEHAVPENTDPEPCIVERCGSCTSLVVRYLQSSWDALLSLSLSSSAGYAQGDSVTNDEAAPRTWDAQAAKMAMASILIDTRNLHDGSQATDTDRAAVAYLESKIHLAGPDASTWDRDAFFHTIDAAKRNLHDLPLPAIFRKDYKEWAERRFRLGISSAVQPLAFLLQQATSDPSPAERLAAFDAAVREHMARRDLTLFAIMTASTSPHGAFERQLLLQSSEEGVGAARRFEDDVRDALRLESFELGEGESDGRDGKVWRRVWRQGDVSQSRKQVAPLLRRAMREGLA